MMYWYPGPYSGFRLYKEGIKVSGFQEDYSPVPAGISCFPKELVVIPPWWTERVHPMRFERVHKKGGHFAAWER